MIIRSEKGQGLAEYALILALIAIAAVLALLFLSGTITEHPQHDRHEAVTDQLRQWSRPRLVRGFDLYGPRNPSGPFCCSQQGQD